MLVTKIHVYRNNVLPISNLKKEQSNSNINVSSNKSIEYAKPPIGYTYGAKINFTGECRNVRVPFIEFENYKAMHKPQKERLRRLCANFDKLVDESQRRVLLSIDKNPENMAIPLQSEKEMDEFIKVANMYSKYKDQPIICLGRSPKWFLNASLWMKDGIPDYKFVAFSGRWFWIYDGDFGDRRGLVRMDKNAPTKAEIKAYRKYLKNIQADPISIIKKSEASGKKTIITDYVDTGKGFTSFLEILADYADDLGVLDKFGRSIEILSIGNKQYRQERKNLEYEPSSPHVMMPPKLEPYDIATTPWGSGQIMEQKYYNIDYDVFKQMLINQNPNECRSTYYPHTAWTVYKPDKFKTGMVSDMKKVKDLVRRLQSDRAIFSFEPVMSAYRNLLNFRILDGLDARGLLKTIHNTKL